MKLPLICGCITKIIQMVSRRASHSRVSCPSRGAKTTRIHVSACRFKHLSTRVIIPAGKFKFHFEPINQSCGSEYNECSTNNGGLTLINTINYHSNCTQRKNMTPNKLQYLNQIIQRVLQFTSASYFHMPELDSLLEYRITQIPLKIRKRWEKISGFLKSIGQKSNTVRGQLHFNKRIGK